MDTGEGEQHTRWKASGQRKGRKFKEEEKAQHEKQLELNRSECCMFLMI